MFRGLLSIHGDNNMYRKTLSVVLILMLTVIWTIPPQTSFSQERKTYHLAVLNHEANGVSETEALVLSETLRSYISTIIQSRQYLSVKGFDRYTEILEREQMNNIFDQFELQNVGCVSDSCAVEFGKMLQVDRIVIGSIGKIGNTYTLSSRIVDVESSKSVNVALQRHRGSIDDLVGSVVQNQAIELLKIDSDWVEKELISIDGFPTKATVYFDDKMIGETPISNELVSKGYHSIRIIHDGYEDFTKDIIMHIIYDCFIFFVPKLFFLGFLCIDFLAKIPNLVNSNRTSSISFSDMDEQLISWDLDFTSYFTLPSPEKYAFNKPLTNFISAL